MATFDPESKEWSGEVQPTVLNPEASLGQILLNFLGRAPSMISQINSANWEEMTAMEIRSRTVRIAQNLMKFGYKKGDILAILTQNNENFAPLVYAGFCIGASIHIMDSKCTSTDVICDLKLVQPKVIFCDMGHLEKIEEAIKDIGIDPKIFVFESSINELLKEIAMEQMYVAHYLGDTKELVAFIANTNDPSRKICISQAQLVEQNNAFKYPDAERMFCTSPLDRVPALVAMVKSVFDGMTRIIHKEGLTPESILNIISKHKVSLLITSVDLLECLSNCPKTSEVDLSTVKFVDSYGGHLDEELKQNIETLLLNGKVGFGYGLSIKGCYVATNFHRSKAGSCGVLIPNMKAKVLNKEGKPLDVGEIGEICLKSDCKFLGFLKDDEGTKAVLTHDNWLKTGDFGFFDEDGFLFVKREELLDDNNNKIEEVIPEIAVKTGHVMITECITREILSEKSAAELIEVISEEPEEEDEMEAAEDIKSAEASDETVLEVEKVQEAEVPKTEEFYDVKEIEENQEVEKEQIIEVQVHKETSKITDAHEETNSKNKEKLVQEHQKAHEKIIPSQLMENTDAIEEFHDVIEPEIVIPKIVIIDETEIILEIQSDKETSVENPGNEASEKVHNSNSIPEISSNNVITVQPTKSYQAENTGYATDDSDPESLLDSLTQSDIILETAKNSKTTQSPARKSMDRKKSIPLPTIPEDKSLENTNPDKKKGHSDGCCCCNGCVIA